jgi:molybdopterin/thiamine biosynthesis adenylyltransferase
MLDVIVPARLLPAVRRAAFSGDVEAGAWLVFRRSRIVSDPWCGEARDRFILREVTPLSAGDIVSASSTHLTVRTESFVRLVARMASEGSIAGFLHGHPGGGASFSAQDDDNERALMGISRKKAGDEAQLVSLLCLPDGKLIARIWGGSDAPRGTGVLVSGAALRVYPQTAARPPEDLDRQGRLFGDNANAVLGGLSAVVVGAGGTGSPMAMMLARAGIGRLGVIDGDRVESTNLHRTLYRRSDIGRPKVEALKEIIVEAGLGVDVRPLISDVCDPATRDLLKAADIIFCCTDDHAGRMMLNRFAYFYEIPLIDAGLAAAKDEHGRLRDLTGRVSLIHPGSACLLCRGVVNPRRAHEEVMKRRNPDEYERLERDGYVLGGGDPEPAFIAMTISVATMALEEFMQILSGFRGDRSPTQRLRRYLQLEDRRSSIAPNAECPICADGCYWGQADMNPFLDRVA